MSGEPNPPNPPAPEPVRMTIDQALAANAELTEKLNLANVTLDKVTTERDQALSVLSAQNRAALREKVAAVTTLSRPQIDGLTDAEMESIVKHAQLVRGASKSVAFARVDSAEDEGLTVGNLFEFGKKNGGQ